MNLTLWKIIQSKNNVFQHQHILTHQHILVFLPHFWSVDASKGQTGLDFCCVVKSQKYKKNITFQVGLAFRKSKYVDCYPGERNFKETATRCPSRNSKESRGCQLKGNSVRKGGTNC